MAILDGYHTEDSLLEALREKKVGPSSKRTLRLWRQRREGPPWTKLGASIVYPDDGFAAWLKTQTQQPARSRRTS